MHIIRNRKKYYIAGGVITALAVLAIIVLGFKPGIDFSGGTIIEVSYPQGRPAIQDVRSFVDGLVSEKSLSVGSYSLRPAGTDRFSIETRELKPDEQQKAIRALSLDGAAEVRIERVNSIGPVIGAQLKQKAVIALGLIILAIILFVAFAFRHVSEPVSSWKYGLATIFALFHDVLVPAGAYVVYSRFTGAEIDLLFVTAVLAILGYSVNDTIVVFDRVRENLRRNQESRSTESFEKTVGKSLDQTIVRSINTSMTLLLVLVAIYAFGSSATRDFMFVLLVGTIAGTYSSIFLASPMLVTMEKLQRKGK